MEPSLKLRGYTLPCIGQIREVAANGIEIDKNRIELACVQSLFCGVRWRDPFGNRPTLLLKFLVRDQIIHLETDHFFYLLLRSLAVSLSAVLIVYSLGESKFVDSAQVTS